MIKEIQNDYKDREETVKNMSMVNTTVKYGKIIGLTDDENRRMNGIWNPPDNIDKSTRMVFLKLQIDYFNEEIENTIKERFKEGGDLEDIEFQKRINGLKTARELTTRQIQKEEITEQQEEDISRLQRFKKWAKENMVGLSALIVSIVGIITTIIVSARKASLRGAQATEEFAKALYNLGQKLGSLIATLLNIIAQVISLGSKGLAWLASNLWVLVVAFTLYLVGAAKLEYRKWRKMK